MDDNFEGEEQMVISASVENGGEGGVLANAEETAPPRDDEQILNQAKERPDFLDDESDEDDFVVTIGEIKTNMHYQKQPRGAAAGAATVDLDANPTLKDGTPIYDLDLATMEDKPWRKPGADVTDYFNYGFNEESWNHYCERQKKFRAEFGSDQSGINRAILSNIQLTASSQINLTQFAGGRQLVNLAGGQDSKPQSQQQQPLNKVQKIVVDLSKPPPSLLSGIIGLGEHSNTPPVHVPLFRTVINESGIVSNQDSSISDLSSIPRQPPPSLLDTSVAASVSQSSAGIESAPSQSPPPGVNIRTSINAVPTSLSSLPLPLDFSKPPPTFDPAIPPPIRQPPAPQPAQQTQTQPQPTSASLRPIVKANIDLPPGVEEIDGPPGMVDAPPGISTMDFSQPPPSSQFTFNQPSALGPRASLFGPPPTLNIPHQQQQPHMYSARPPPLFQPSFRPSFGFGGAGRIHDRFRHTRTLFRGDDRSSDSENESGHTRRKRRRSISKSPSPSSSRRHKEEKRKGRESKEKDRDSKKKKEKEKKDKHKSRHRSPQEGKRETSKTIKSERRSSERDKETEKESSRTRSSKDGKERKEKETSRTAVKTERRSPE